MNSVVTEDKRIFTYQYNRSEWSHADVSEMCAASVVLVPEAVCTSETSGYFNETTRRSIPKSYYLHLVTTC
jgi:hypothetical protein